MHVTRGSMHPPDRLRVGLHESVAASAEEVRYSLRTLLRIAGFGSEFVWHRADEESPAPFDIYYGPQPDGVSASLRIRASGRSFRAAGEVEPNALVETAVIPVLRFAGETETRIVRDGSSAMCSADLVFGVYWLLSGAREPTYRRDRWDNLHLDGSFALRSRLIERPLVSMAGTWIREHFAAAGKRFLLPPWITGGRRAAFALTHDVDYPEIIRWIEAPRAVASGLGWDLARRVLSGASHFWQFDGWVDLAERMGTRPTFYFMARRGSLLKYARGMPDAFYDIRTPRFRRLFRELRERGCEIGLHASYHAHRSENLMRQELELLRDVADTDVVGNRHHYWHLDPAAPAETLRMHERVGLRYDSSLGLEFHPGFRRGTCHPFRPFDPNERREVGTVQLPPTWMDDHFDRRLRRNRIADPDTCAQSLVEQARRNHGIVVVDYHARGMNSDFFPRYGPWLGNLLTERLETTDLEFLRASDLAAMYVAYESALDAAPAAEPQQTPVTV